MIKNKGSNNAMRLVVNYNKDNLYLNVAIWAGSIMTNASSCRLEHRSLILRQSTATSIKEGTKW